MGPSFLKGWVEYATPEPGQPLTGMIVRMSLKALALVQVFSNSDKLGVLSICLTVCFVLLEGILLRRRRVHRFQRQ